MVAGLALACPRLRCYCPLLVGLLLHDFGGGTLGEFEGDRFLETRDQSWKRTVSPGFFDLM